MQYVSTRDQDRIFTSEDVLNLGLAPDGGLFVPKEFPSFTNQEITNLKNTWVIKTIIGVIVVRPKCFQKKGCTPNCWVRYLGATCDQTAMIQNDMKLILP